MKLFLIILFSRWVLPTSTTPDIGFFTQITNSYFESREIRTITFISCLNLQENAFVYKKLSTDELQIKIVTDDINRIDLRNQGFQPQGIVGDINCELFREMMATANSKFLFTNSFYWLIFDLGKTKSDEDYREIFKEFDVYPSSEVAVATNRTTYIQLIDIYKTGKMMTPIITELGGAVNSSNIRCDFFGNTPTSRRRHDLQGIFLPSAIVIAFPDIFTRIDDLRLAHIDTFARGNYPTVVRLSEDLNFRINLRQLDNFGWNHNGTFDGLMGLFQRNEIELGTLAVLMRDDRIPIVEWTAETFAIKSCILFRQPPLSAVSNIFLLPFSTSVWIAIVLLFLFAELIFLFQWTIPTTRNYLHPLDTISFILGTVCQQGFYLSLRSFSGRIMVFFTFVAAIFLYTSYAANIVALLQSPSNVIKSISDLIRSPLQLSVQDTVYNHIYFNESTNPIVRDLFNAKIRSREGDAFIYDIADGVRRMRMGMFAFQVETHAAYQIMSNTFDEHEKCGVKELEAIQLPMTTIPVRKHSPYKELFTQRLRWQRENGLIRRDYMKIIPQKPKCINNFGRFVSVGLMECRPALIALAIGIAASLVIFVLENIIAIVHRRVGIVKSKRRFNQKLRITRQPFLH